MIRSNPDGGGVLDSTRMMVSESDHAQFFIIGRIFCGEPIPTAPENALACRCGEGAIDTKDH
jgi:hypothetical protein